MAIQENVLVSGRMIFEELTTERDVDALDAACRRSDEIVERVNKILGYDLYAIGAQTPYGLFLAQMMTDPRISETEWDEAEELPQDLFEAQLRALRDISDDDT